MNFFASRFLCPYQNQAKVGNYEMARTHLNTMKFCGVELIYGLKITILGLYDLQIPYEGQRERPAVIVENRCVICHVQLTKSIHDINNIITATSDLKKHFVGPYNIP